ncbi:transporter substrate-binding domain-containing protein [Mesorhizobium sp. J18]|uniref:transporter substrate-binding domain-containing protein n=1 Tax=Mesorhizobium sp. J18 TaxID=935263 RepID=UPI0016485F19|nr:transporter substrate-binding domain-containing protein [Mesorhizobium sp. J18]
MSQAQDALERAKSAGVLQVATEMQYPPYDFLQGGQHVGYNVDLFNEISKEIGLKVEFTDLPWSSVLPGLEAGKYDVVAGPAAITEERSERFRFLVPISESQTTIMIRTDYDGIAKPEDIAGKKIGVQRAATASKELASYAATLSEPPVVTEYVDYSQANADLAAGRLDGVANMSNNALYAAAQRPESFAVIAEGFGATSYSSFLGRKDDDSKALLDLLNEAMLTIKHDGRMAKIQEKWFGKAQDLPDQGPTFE